MSADAGKSTHFDAFGGVVTEEIFCSACDFDRKFDTFDTLFDILADFS